MSRTFNLFGLKFGRLLALDQIKLRGRIHWKCLCDCGKVVYIQTASLRSGNTRSCGCLHSELLSIARKTHGQSGTKEYAAWNSMIQRCTNKNLRDYKDYGGRGITVCERWLVFENFFADMGLSPGKNYSVDRKDNDGNYTPENCRWATPKEQANNRRRKWPKT